MPEFGGSCFGIYFVSQQEEASEAEELVMASLEWVKDPEEDVKQAWERKLVVSSCFSEAFSEMVGLCKNSRWVSCCCVLSMLITGGQNPFVGQKWREISLTGFFLRKRMITYMLCSCWLILGRAPFVQAVLEGKGRWSRSISKGK